MSWLQRDPSCEGAIQEVGHTCVHPYLHPRSALLHSHLMPLLTFDLASRQQVQGDPPLPLLAPDQRRSVALLARCLGGQPALLEWMQRQVGVFERGWHAN
jgi:hypothetical protein